MQDLAGLRPALPPSLALVTPQAPFPGAPWGYGQGWAWYQYVEEDRVVPETLHASLEHLDTFLDALPSILGQEPGPILLGGFSQGGTTSLAYGLTRPERVALVANFSGFLASEPALPVEERGSQVPDIFWGHGTLDPAIPHRLAVSGRARLVAAGAPLTAHDYDIGHWIAPEELSEFNHWAGERLDATATGS
jgi:phospholipase/carboxylesterase